MTINQPLYSYSKHPTLPQQIQDLVSKYESIKEPSHALRYLLRNSDYDNFCDLIKHHIELIKSRPQAIEDGHVTIYDKCLLELCRDGREVCGLAGQEFYIREFMGIDSDLRSQRDVDMLDQEVFVRGVFVQSSTSRPRSNSQYGQSSSADEKVYATPANTPHAEVSPPLQNFPFRETSTDTYNVSSLSHNPTISSNIQRVLHTYFQAKNDFYTGFEGDNNTDVIDTTQKAEAAKFLRDSAENALNYLRAQGIISSSLSADEDYYKDNDALGKELEALFDYAKSKAIDFLGGKKRRFEVESCYKGVSSPSSSSLSSYAAITRKERLKNNPDYGRQRFAGDRYVGRKYEKRLWHPYARPQPRR